MNYYVITAVHLENREPIKVKAYRTSAITQPFFCKFESEIPIVL